MLTSLLGMEGNYVVELHQTACISTIKYEGVVSAIGSLESSRCPISLIKLICGIWQLKQILISQGAPAEVFEKLGSAIMLIKKCQTILKCSPGPEEMMRSKWNPSSHLFTCTEASYLGVMLEKTSWKTLDLISRLQICDYCTMTFVLATRVEAVHCFKNQLKMSIKLSYGTLGKALNRSELILYSMSISTKTFVKILMFFANHVVNITIQRFDCIDPTHLAQPWFWDPNEFTEMVYRK